MNYVTETITPEKAKQYYDTSLGNRPISKSRVMLYADSMKRGKWLLNGMCIIFDDNGHLQDGHHRLLAVIEAGIPVMFDVCRGANSAAFTTYDCGRHRTLGQLLAIKGTKNYNMVGAIVLANEQLEKSGRLTAHTSDGGSTGTKKKSNMDNFETYSKDPEGYDAAAVVIVRLSKKCRIIAGSWAGGLYYYLTHKGGYKEEEVLPFFEALFSLESSDITIVNMLRKTITKVKMEGKKLLPEMQWAFIAKAWNYYVDGVCPKILKYTPSQEPLPILKIRS